MRQIKNILFPAVMLTAAVLSVPEIEACGFDPQVSFLKGDQKFIRSIDKKALWKHFINTFPEMFSPVVFRDGMECQEAQIHDFAAAVKKHFPNMAEADRQKMVDTWTRFLDDYYAGKKTTLNGYPDFPEELAEFRLYLQGFDELEQDVGAKPESWYKLLSLPAERRHFRTVWVHYILGNWDKANLHTHAAHCREAAAAGFSDSAGLAWGSYKQEARYGTDPVKIIRAIAEGDRGEPDFDMISYYVHYNLKYGTFQGVLKKISDADYERIMEDPVGREFALIFDDTGKRFQALCKSRKFRNSAVLAYYHWNRSEVDSARHWISMQGGENLISLYLEADLALYDGNQDLAVKKLQRWLEIAKNSTISDAEIRFLYSARDEYSYYGVIGWKMEIYGKLGSLMVAKKNYMLAAEYFFRAGRDHTDFPAIADMYLSLDELCTLTDKLRKEFSKRPDSGTYIPFYDLALNLAHLTARRAFREGKFDIAREYMPEKYKGYLESYLQYVAYAEDIKNGSDKRAIALYNAAKIMRYKGMELCGTESAPDNHCLHGDYYLDGGNPVFKIDFVNAKCQCSLEYGSWTLCDEHAAVVREHAPAFLISDNKLSVLPHRRWHYRTRAAEMALRAGEMAQDDDLRALIHLFGGIISDEDIFYKRLVWRSWNTKLARVADKKRWFPKNIPPLMDEVSKTDPIMSLEEVKFLMKLSFPEPDGRASK